MSGRSTPESIQTLDDPRVADYRQLSDLAYLNARGLFVAEGRLVLKRLLTSTRFETESILLTPAARDNVGSVLDLARAPIYLAAQELMNQLVGFNIHRGCLALARRPPEAILDAGNLIGLSRLVVLEGVNNPDNVGGIFRSAAAFGVELVVLGPECGDPLYRKAVRTSMAASLAVPFVVAADWPATLTTLHDQGFQVMALTPAQEALPIDDIARGGRVALLLGAEGDGLTHAALAAATQLVRIPTSSQVDSLNVTTAASIAMHHFFGPHIQ